MTAILEWVIGAVLAGQLTQSGGLSRHVDARTPYEAASNYVAAIVLVDSNLYMNATIAKDNELRSLLFAFLVRNRKMQCLLEKNYGEGAVELFNARRPPVDGVELKWFPTNLEATVFQGMIITNVDKAVVCYIPQIDTECVICVKDGRYSVDVQAGIDPGVWKERFLKPSVARIDRGIAALMGKPPTNIEEVVRTCYGALKDAKKPSIPDGGGDGTK